MFSISNVVKKYPVLSVAWLTILVTRVSLLLATWLTPRQLWMEDSWHHFYTGVLLVALAVFLLRAGWYRKILLGIGLGLMLDQLCIPLIIFFGYEMVDYWSVEAYWLLFLGLIGSWLVTVAYSNFSRRGKQL